MIDIKDGGTYVIRCRDAEEIRFLFNYARTRGMLSLSNDGVDKTIARATREEPFINNDIGLRFDNRMYRGWGLITYYEGRGYTITEFDDVFEGLHVSTDDYAEALSGLEESIGSWF